MKKLLLIITTALLLQSCSDKICPAYGNKFKTSKESKKQGGCYFN